MIDGLHLGLNHLTPVVQAIASITIRHCRNSLKKLIFHLKFDLQRLKKMKLTFQSQFFSFSVLSTALVYLSQGLVRVSEKPSTLENLDYRDDKYFFVTPVRNQNADANCTIDWIFAALGAFEAQWAMKTGELIRLSAQSLLDCMELYTSRVDCAYRPFTASVVFEYLILGNPVAPESELKYVGVPAKVCNHRIQTDSGVRMTNFDTILEPTKDAIINTIKQRGPSTIVVGVYDSFSKYSGGVYHCGAANERFLSWQSMLVIGYGVTPTNEEYLLLKNSWGENWGEDGYVKISFDSCIFKSLQTPIV